MPPMSSPRSSMKSNQHVYEVITEDAACKLYFDLEFGLKCNLGVKGVEVLEVFVQYLCYLVRLCFGLAVDRNHILDLDSRSEWAGVGNVREAGWVRVMEYVCACG